MTPNAETSLHGRFNYPVDYRIGAGCASALAQATRELAISRPLIVTDPGVRTLDWFTPLCDGLATAGITAAVFSDIAENPSDSDIAQGIAAFAEHRADGCILIGGGSVLDAGKCIALLAHNRLDVFALEDGREDWQQVETDRIAPTIALPTTAGTGSEVGRAAVIRDPRDGSKKIIFHPQLAPNRVLADPVLTTGLPPRLTAATGMDAFAHCFEAFCAPAYHPMADGIALEGMRLIGGHLVAAFDDGADLAARTQMLMAAAMGATAFQKGLGLIHALSHPLGGLSGLHHGTANAIFQPYVMVHNRSFIETKCARIASALELEDIGFDPLLEWVLELRGRLGLPASLASVIDKSLVPEIARLAARDPSLATNPKPCSLPELERVLLKTIDGDLSP